MQTMGGRHIALPLMVVMLAAASIHGARRSMPVPATLIAPDMRVDVNTARAAELDLLPRIGPALAARIVETRRSRPYGSVEDLRRVHGIGPRTVEQIGSFATASAVDGED